MNDGMNTMESCIAASDLANIGGAIKAFYNYLATADFYRAEKDELQKQINVIKNTIEGTRARIGTFSISDRAIRMAEELRDMSAMDRLFINFCTDNNKKAIDWHYVHDNQEFVCAFKSPVFDECDRWIKDHGDDDRYTIYSGKLPCHVRILGESEVLFTGYHTDCEKFIAEKHDEGSQVQYSIAPAVLPESEEGNDNESDDVQESNAQD